MIFGSETLFIHLKSKYAKYKIQGPLYPIIIGTWYNAASKATVPEAKIRESETLNKA